MPGDFVLIERDDIEYAAGALAGTMQMGVCPYGFERERITAVVGDLRAALDAPAQAVRHCDWCEMQDGGALCSGLPIPQPVSPATVEALAGAARTFWREFMAVTNAERDVDLLSALEDSGGALEEALAAYERERGGAK